MGLLKKIYHRIRWICSIRIFMYLYYNYFSPCVIRDKDSHLIPYKGAILELQRGSKLILRGGDVSVGVNRIGNSKSETCIRLMKNAVWESYGQALLCYGTTVDVHIAGKLKTGNFFMNTGSVAVVAKSVSIGDDVLIGRDNVIYDSDFHSMTDEKGQIRNFPEKVVIEDHVWMTNHVMIQKGVTVHAGAIITPFTIVKKDINANALVINGTYQTEIGHEVFWSRKDPGAAK